MIRACVLASLMLVPAAVASAQTAGQAPFDQNAGPVTDGQGRPQDAGERSADDPAAGRAHGRTADDADVGQPGTSPGTRGGATAFGGIEREPAKTKPDVKTP